MFPLKMVLSLFINRLLNLGAYFINFCDHLFPFTMYLSQLDSLFTRVPPLTVLLMRVYR